jgi:ABC-type oligopeptide transport system substrate-binding subunit
MSTLPRTTDDRTPPGPVDPETPGWEPPEEEPRAWTRAAIAGTVLLIGAMVAAGLFAAWMVTPPADEEALARPSDTDLVIASGSPLSWDPAAIADSVSAQLLTQVYEGLTALDARDQVRPALAESWTLGADGRELVFDLRDDLTFSDGSPLEAEDVRRSWLRVLDPASPSPLSSLLDDVAGAAAYARGEGSRDDVGLRADGDRLTVEFDRPAAYFPAVASVPTLAVVPDGIDAQAAGPSERVDFVASGPYLPEAWLFDEIRLAANEGYWAGRPAVDRITVLTDDGGRSSVDVFEDGAVDWTRISDFDASWIRYDRNLGPQLRYADEVLVEFLGFDTTRPPFDGPAARRAVAMAVDWRGLAALDDPDSAAPSSIVPPGAVGRSDGDYLLPHDPDAARAELADAGYPEGEGFPAVTLMTYGIGPTDAIAADLRRELGIEVVVEQRPFTEHSMLLDSDTPELWTLAWSADYPHAQNFLGLLLRSDSRANVGGWSDPDFDRLLDSAAATDDASTQVARYSEAQAVVREAAPLIPLGYGGSWSLSRDDLRGAAVSGVGTLRFADLVLE